MQPKAGTHLSESGRNNLTGGGMSLSIHLVFWALIVLFMANLNALVDAVFHPEIPYFDSEHIIVGITTALVSAVLFGALLMYIRNLSNALATIRTLEDFLSICSHCKKVRNADGDPGELKSWQPIETYVTERTQTQFSHGICPECLHQLFPDTARRLRSR